MRVRSNYGVQHMQSSVADKSQASGCLQFAQVSSGAGARAIDARKVIRSEEFDLDFRFSLALRFVFASLLVSSTLFFFPFINYATL